MSSFLRALPLACSFVWHMAIEQWGRKLTCASSLARSFMLQKLLASDWLALLIARHGWFSSLKLYKKFKLSITFLRIKPTQRCSCCTGAAKPSTWTLLSKYLPTCLVIASKHPSLKYFCNFHSSSSPGYWWMVPYFNGAHLLRSFRTQLYYRRLSWRLRRGVWHSICQAAPPLITPIYTASALLPQVHVAGRGAEPEPPRSSLL